MKHTKLSRKATPAGRQGFTLIELLVVIAIIAILSIVVILTLNPAELLRQARDSNRVSDLNTMKSAIALYSADTSNTVGSTTLKVYLTVATTAIPAAYVATGYTTSTPTAATLRSVNGAGWVPINFTLISSGSPIGTEPLDPAQSGDLAYSYKATSTTANNTFKLAARVESVKYSASGTGDVASTDGGNSNFWYETGTELNM